MEKTWLCQTRVESYFESTMKWPLLSRKENSLGNINFKRSAARELKSISDMTWNCEELNKIGKTLKKKTKIKYFLLSLWSFFLFLLGHSPTAVRRPTARSSPVFSFIQLLLRHRQGWPAVRPQASPGKHCSQISNKLNNFLSMFWWKKLQQHTSCNLINSA